MGYYSGLPYGFRALYWRSLGMRVDGLGRSDHNGCMDSGVDGSGVPRVPLREAKATFSELVARADLVGEVTVLTKHGRGGCDRARMLDHRHCEGASSLRQLWAYLDRWCPPAWMRTSTPRGNGTGALVSGRGERTD